MASYHIKDDGNPALCRAEKKNCPKGGEHFENEKDARKAVEKLFGAALPKGQEKTKTVAMPVYTAKGAAENFSGLFNGAHFNYDASVSALIMDETTAQDVIAVKKILTNKDLRNKTTNTEAQEEISAFISNRYNARTLSEDPDRRLTAAATMATLMPILTKKYGFKDPRSEKQIQADQAYLEGHRGDEAALRDGLRGSAAYSLAPYDAKEIAGIKAIGDRIDGDLSKLTSNEIHLMARYNPRGNIVDRSETTVATADGDWHEAVELEKRASELPSEYSDLLKPEATAEGVAKAKEKAASRLAKINVPNGAYGERFDLFEVANKTLENRANNKILAQAVLDA